MDLEEMHRRAHDPERPQLRWVAILRDDHPPLEQMAQALCESLLGIDYVREASADAQLSSYTLGPDGPRPALRGSAVLVPLAELPEDDPDYRRVMKALSSQAWVEIGVPDGVLPPHPTAQIESAVEDHHRHQAAVTVRQIIEDSRYDWLSDEQRELAIAINTLWANQRMQLRARGAGSFVDDQARMQVQLLIDVEVARELGERGNLPSWMWDERFWDALALPESGSG